MHHLLSDQNTQNQRIIDVGEDVRLLQLQLNISPSNSDESVELIDKLEQASNSDEHMTVEQVEKLEQEMKELELEMKQEVELIRALEDQKLELIFELADIEKRRKLPQDK
jgi:hypothetical protein